MPRGRPSRISPFSASFRFKTCMQFRSMVNLNDNYLAILDRCVLTLLYFQLPGQPCICASSFKLLISTDPTWRVNSVMIDSGVSIGFCHRHISMWTRFHSHAYLLIPEDPYSLASKRRVVFDPKHNRQRAYWPKTWLRSWRCVSSYLNGTLHQPLKAWWFIQVSCKFCISRESFRVRSSETTSNELIYRYLEWIHKPKDE